METRRTRPFFERDCEGTSASLPLPFFMLTSLLVSSYRQPSATFPQQSSCISTVTPFECRGERCTRTQGRGRLWRGVESGWRVWRGGRISSCCQGGEEVTLFSVSELLSAGALPQPLRERAEGSCMESNQPCERNDTSKTRESQLSLIPLAFVAASPTKHA
jgi:hypothetical protein